MQIHTVWSETVTLNSKAGNVVFGSVLLQSREVTATSADPREVFKPASLDTDSTGAAIAQVLPKIYPEPEAAPIFCLS